MTDTDTDTGDAETTTEMGSEATTEVARDVTVRRLDEATRRKIAAGEVVTRPAAVVRELVENSLDAGAARISVAVDGDGTERIQVRDDGHGMSAADAERAVDRHATSKISGPDDVDRVATLGFRGEALPSIAAVSALTLTTNDGGARGVEVRVGRESSPDDAETRPAGRARGTTVTVRDLFHDRPARRKSLASPAAEFARVSRLLQRYALLHPDVAVALSHDGRETFSTPGTGATDALLGVYDRTVAGESTTVEATVASSDGDEPLSVRGVVCYPSVTRATRDHVHVAVDGRPVADESLRNAVVAGYGSLLPSGRAPIVALRVSVPPGGVDHNVHPAKAEVTLRDEAEVTTAVERAVREALSTADLRRSADVAMDLDSSLTRVDGDSRFDDVSVIGQFRGLYLLCEVDDDLLVVDQHAAHERINYERLCEAVGDVPAVELDPPVTVSVAPDAASVAAGRREEVAALGYEVESLGGGTLSVRSVPAPLGRTAAPESIRDVLESLARGNSGDAVADRDALLADLACHPSLKAGDDLSVEDATRLLERLGACEQPYACPHGRPTVLSIEESAFVRGFERHARLD